MFSIRIKIFILSYFSIIVSANAVNWEKLVEKTNTSIEVGDFAKGAKYLDKLESKSIKKLGSDNVYLPYIAYNRAYIQLHKGLINNIDEVYGNVSIISKQIYGKESKEYGQTLTDLAHDYVALGNPLKARSFLDQAKMILRQYPEWEEYMMHQFNIKEAEIHALKGEYDSALYKITLSEDFFLENTADRKSYINESGKLISEKIDKDILTQRLQEYAYLLNLKSSIYNQKGEFRSSDSAFMVSENWIEDKLGKRDIEYARNQYLFGKMLALNGVKDLPTKYLENAYFVIEKIVEPAHPLAITIRYKLLEELIYSKQGGKLKTLSKATKKVINSNFTSESIYSKFLDYFSALYRVELGEDINSTTLSKVKTDLEETLLPSSHPWAMLYNDLLYRIYTLDLELIAAEQVLSDNVNLAVDLTGNESLISHLQRLDLAIHYIRYTNKISEAAQLFKTSFEKVVKPGIAYGHPDYVRLLSAEATVFELTDQFKKASETLDIALLATQKKYDNKDIEYGKGLEQIASLYINIGQYKEAEKTINEAIEILEEYDESYERIFTVKAYETKARLLGIFAEYDDAEDLIKDAAKLFEISSENYGYSIFDSYELLASLYIELGRYNETQIALDKIIEDKKYIYGEESRFLIKPEADRSKLYLAYGDYNKAQTLASHALDIANNIFGDSSIQAIYPAKALVKVFVTLGDYDKAEEYLEQMLPVLRAKYGNDHISVAFVLSDLAMVNYYKGNDLSVILTQLEESESIISKSIGITSPAYAQILERMAMVYIKKGEPAKALELLKQTEEIWRDKAGRRNNIKTANVYMLIGDVYYSMKDYKEAEKQYSDAGKLYETYFDENHPEYVQVLSRLSKVYYMQGDRRKARSSIEEVLGNYRNFIDKYFSSLSEREKTKYWNTIKDDFEFYATVTLKLHDRFPELVDNLYNNALLTKALLLSSSIKIREKIMNGDDEELKQLYFYWQEQRERLTLALSMTSEQLAEEGIVLNNLANEVEKTEKELSRKSDVFANEEDKREILTWENIKSGLNEDEVAVEVIRFRYFDHIFTDSILYALVYIKGDKRADPELLVLENGTELEGKYLNSYRNSIRYGVTDGYSYSNYWKPIEKEFGKFSNLFFSPDGVFTQINLETIPLNSGGYVLDTSSIILVNNTKDIYFEEKEKNRDDIQKQATMFGDPDFYVKMDKPNASNTLRGEAIAELPGTKQEIEELYDVLTSNGWRVDYYLDSLANEDKVKMLANPRVFHVATHGFFQPMSKENQLIGEVSEAKAVENPLLRSGLLLSGAGDLLANTLYNYNIESGVLTAYEAMNLNLDETELVVLSACETGLGDVAIGEGVYGLQRAFLVAGAQNLIMSLFKVSDEATQKLMVEFYKNWLETNDKRRSFIEAKKSIREVYKEPLYWGAFVMIGI